MADVFDQIHQQAQPSGDVFSQLHAQAVLEAQKNTSSQQIAGDIGLGVLKGFGQAANDVSQTLNKIPYVGQYLAPRAGINAAQQIETPTNQAQRIGAIGGHLAGTGALVAAGGEVLPEAIAPRIIGQAGIGAAVNPEHPVAGALLGGATEGGAQALKTIAPEFVNSAMGIGERSKRFGRNPAQTILEETSGVRMSTLGKNIQSKIDSLSDQLDAAAKANPNAKVDLSPALQKILDIADELHSQNYHDADPALQKLWNHLTIEGDTGAAIPTQVSPEKAILLKRGLQKRVTSWVPGAGSEEAVFAKQLQHIVGDSISQAVPDTAPINAKIANLIEGGKRAGVTERSAGATQRLLHQATIPTGALMSGDIGAHLAGAPGAAMAVAAQQFLKSPVVKMLIGRGLYVAPEVAAPTVIPLSSLATQGNQ